MTDYSDFHAWLTTLEGKKFLVLQAYDGTAEYYVYHIEFGEDKIITHDITLKEGGTAAITSIEAYRDEVKASMRHEDFLAEMIEWTKE